MSIDAAAFQPTILSLRGSLMARTGRYALSPLFRAFETKEIASLPPEERNKRLLMRLFYRKRSRIVEMQEQGLWQAVSTGSRNALIACPIVDAITNAKYRRPCKRPDFCPFCWVRQHTYVAYREFRRVLFPETFDEFGDFDPAPGLVLPPPVELRGVTTSVRFDAEHWYPRDVWSWASENKRKFTTQTCKENYGGMIISSVSPDADNGFLLTMRGLWLVARKHAAYRCRPPADLEPTHEGMTIRQKYRRFSFTFEDQPKKVRDAQYAKERAEVEAARKERRPIDRGVKATHHDPLSSLTQAVGHATMFDHELLCQAAKYVGELLEQRQHPDGRRCRVSERYGVIRDASFGGTPQDWRQLDLKSDVAADLPPVGDAFCGL